MGKPIAELIYRSWETPFPVEFALGLIDLLFGKQSEEYKALDECDLVDDIGAVRPKNLTESGYYFGEVAVWKCNIAFPLRFSKERDKAIEEAVDIAMSMKTRRAIAFIEHDKNRGVIMSNIYVRIGAYIISVNTGKVIPFNRESIKTMLEWGFE